MNVPSEQKDDSVVTLKSDIEKAKKEILDALRNRESKWWKILIVALPVILTAGLGYLLSGEIEQAKNHQQLLMEKSKTFYEKRFEIYTVSYGSLVTIYSSIKTGNTNDKDLAEAIAFLNEQNCKYKLILSPHVYDLLYKAWSTIFQTVCKKNVIEPETVKDIENIMEDVEKEMKKELRLREPAT